jgi:hypothetical protein
VLPVPLVLPSVSLIGAEPGEEAAHLGSGHLLGWGHPDVMTARFLGHIPEGAALRRSEQQGLRIEHRLVEFMIESADQTSARRATGASSSRSGRSV